MDAIQTTEVKKQKLYRPAPPCLVYVKNLIDVTPNLRRITFVGEDISNFPEFCPGAHIKVFLPLSHQTSPVLPTITSKGNIWENRDEKPLIRTYSVRKIRTHLQEIDIEFVLHGDNSPASSFAENAKSGDIIGLSRPSGPDPMAPSVENFYMVGDLTALPAISAMLEVMPSHVKGHIWLSVLSEKDRIPLIKPEGVNLTYYVSNDKQLIEDVMQFDFSTHNVHHWIAGEENLVVPLRKFLLKERKIKKTNMYAIPYWRLDLKEEDYHQTRHDIMDQV